MSDIMPLPIIFVSSDQEKINLAIEQELAKLSVKSEHPDVLTLSEKINLEQIKKISQHLIWKSVKKQGRVVILNPADSLTLDAQNGLLKLLEEPPGNAIIMIGVQDESHLLPTVLSRCEVRYIHQISEEQELIDIRDLLELPVEDRLERVEKIEDRKKLQDNLIQFYYQKLPNHPEYGQLLQTLIESNTWIKQNVSAKAVTDYLMLILPQSRKIN
jgi:DNA polymerase III delta prime subunit